MEKRLLSVAEAAKLLNVGETLVRELCYSGELTSIKLGTRRLIPEGKLDEFVERKIREQEEEKEANGYATFAIKPFERRGSRSEVRLRANR